MKRLLKGLVCAAMVAAPTVVLAQEAQDQTKVEQPEREAVEAVQEQQEEDTGPNTGKISVLAGIDLATAYYFRGYNQEDTGIILQPYANLYVKLHEGEEQTVTAYVGTWNSWHEVGTLADPGAPGQWYESDFIAGVDWGIAPFTIGFIYTAYTYPGGAFDTIQELGVKLSWDDADFAEDKLPFALKPYIGVYAETNDENGSEDWYGEIGINPGVYTIDEDGKYPVSLSVPITVGFSLKDYYFDDGGDETFLGYGSIGLTAGVPMAFIPEDYGTWTLTGSVQYIHLFAETLDDLNAGDDWDVIGKVGISVAY